ncbi:MAG: hypothetical protein ABIY37_00635 [Devosia sp.]
MIKRLVAGVVALGLLTGPVLAGAPTAAQKAEFYASCVKTSNNTELCTCKAAAAIKLVDEDFMAVIVASMQGKTLADQYAVAYNDYIVESTRACGMGM